MAIKHIKIKSKTEHFVHKKQDHGYLWSKKYGMMTIKGCSQTIMSSANNLLKQYIYNKVV